MDSLELQPARQLLDIERCLLGPGGIQAMLRLPHIRQLHAGGAIPVQAYQELAALQERIAPDPDRLIGAKIATQGCVECYLGGTGLEGSNILSCDTGSVLGGAEGGRRESLKEAGLMVTKQSISCQRQTNGFLHQ